MNDDKLTRDEQAIIRFARPHEDPSDAVRDRVHGAVLARVAGAVAVGTTVAAASATAKAATSATVFTMKTILSSALIVGGFAAVGVGAALIIPEPAQPEAASPPAFVESEPADARPSPPAPPTTTAEQIAPAPPAAEARPPAASAPSASAEPPEDRLVSEVALLQRAQKRLQAGDAAGALALLDDHARSYPDGAMRQEAAAARIFALCSAGRRDEAKAAAARFLRDAPSSPLAQRVRTACP